MELSKVNSMFDKVVFIFIGANLGFSFETNLVVDELIGVVFECIDVGRSAIEFCREKWNENRVGMIDGMPEWIVLLWFFVLFPTICKLYAFFDVAYFIVLIPTTILELENDLYIGFCVKVEIMISTDKRRL